MRYERKILPMGAGRLWLHEADETHVFGDPSARAETVWRTGRLLSLYDPKTESWRPERASGNSSFISTTDPLKAVDLYTQYRPDLVVSAGFMKLAGAAFLAAFGGRYVNTHPALLPSFPGTRGAADAVLCGEPCLPSLVPTLRPPGRPS